MSTFFNRQRFGQAQIMAGFLLLIFLGQCLWLVSHDLRRDRVDPDEMFRIEAGLTLWGAHRSPLAHAGETPRDSDPLQRSPSLDHHHSRLYYLIAAAPFLVWPGNVQLDSFQFWGWLARAPYLLFGVMLGASLWYVARRLYGNAGGYIALVLYCFSPGIIRSSSLWFREPETGAAWGAFGAVFTAVAVAHTLYAPREVVLWNWRRIVLLGVSLGLAVGSQFSLVILFPLVLAILLYLAPTRQRAAIVIWLAGCALAHGILLASYFFHYSEFAENLKLADFFPFTTQAARMPGAYLQLLAEIGQNCPALVLAVPASLIAYFTWPRTRYFGNTAPLLISIIFLALGFLMPHYPGLGFRLLALLFLFLFVSGVFSDLLESRQHSLVLACVVALLGAYSIWNLLELARVRG
jgi:4-amino-4-deoxy-L-arabinose transferase-like glycosyltransferase